MAITFGPYFAIVASGRFHGDLPNLRQLGLFAITAIVQMLILAVGTALLRRASPGDAHMPLDERDRAIMRRSMTTAYYVLIGGIILVGCVMPFMYTGWAIVNAALLTIIAAEVVHYAVVVLSYRHQT